MYKSRLQELCQQRSWNKPEYAITRDGPAHNSRFTVTVTVNGESFQSQTLWKSSKEAQNDAACVAFHHFTNPKPPPPQPSILASFSHFPQPSLSTSPGALSVSTDLDAVPATRHTLQPKVEEVYETPPVNDTTLHVNGDNRSRDMQHLYKNPLQNYAQKRNLSLPVYSYKCEGPPHASCFKCKVTIDGQTYESPEFFSTLKDAEHAAAKVALLSLSPDGVGQNDSGLYKNLLQELVQKEGFCLPVYETNRSGEAHIPIFISSVEINGEVFKGQEARNKKQAEMNAAKVAYSALKERKCKSGQSPLTLSPAHHEQKAPEFSSFSLQSNVTADLHQLAGPKTLESVNPCYITKQQGEEDKGKTFYSAPCMYENILSSPSSSSDGSTNWIVESLVPPAGTSSSGCERVYVFPRVPNMIPPKGYTILPMSDDKWVAFTPQ